MADFPGSDFGLTALTYGPTTFLDGRTEGFAVSSLANLAIAINIEALNPQGVAGNLTAVDEGGPAVPKNNWPGVFQELTPGMDWFERVHVWPRTGVDYGNIVTQVDALHEVYSAHREATITLGVVTINPTIGVVIPDLPALPYVFPAQTSILGPTSMPLAPVRQIVRALPQGAPSFDSNILFQLSTGQVAFLRVQGDRISLLITPWVDAPTETLQWRTDVMQHQDGSEQRVSYRKQPRQLLSGSIDLTALDRQRMHALLYDWQSRTFTVPVWSEVMTLAVAASIGATVLTVDSTDNVDLRVGGLVAVYTDSSVFDIAVVTAKTSTTITLQTGTANAYPAGTQVIPARLAHAQPRFEGQRYPVNLDELSVQFRVTDNDTGAPTASTTGWSTYLGKVLLDDCNLVDRASPYSVEQEIVVIDNDSGVVTQSSPWSRGQRPHLKGFLTRSRADLFKLRRLLYAFRGRQVSFWIPTFVEDLTVVATLGSGASTMDISNVGYTRYVRARREKAHFRITFTDGTSLFRVVSSSIEVSSTVERLTLTSSWPSTRLASEVRRVEFLEPVRLDSDEVRIEHSTIPGVAKVRAPVRTVFET